MTPSTALMFAAAFVAVSPASAASSAWHQTEGGRVRIVTAGEPVSGGKLRGVLQIDLKPGWKTYWRDPGSAGVPPSIDVSGNPNVAAVTIDFPAPIRVDDGGSIWAGYDRPVDLPVTFDTTAPTGPIDANVFLGICKTICIPVQATLRIDPAVDSGNAQDDAAIEAAFAKIPAPAGDGFEAVTAQPSETSLIIEARLPGSADKAELFLAGNESYMFGTPKRSVEGGKAMFTVEILMRPKQKPANGGIHYTLVGEVGAVTGTLPYF